MLGGSWFKGSYVGGFYNAYMKHYRNILVK